MARSKAKSTTRSKAKPPKARGGARPGAGRKRDRLPDEVITRLGAVPQTAADLDVWARRLLAELVVLQMKAQIGPELAASIRATVAEIRKSTAVRGTPAYMAPDDEDLEDDAAGPELVNADDGEALRVG